jgi:hypothetical protein
MKTRIGTGLACSTALAAVTGWLIACTPAGAVAPPPVTGCPASGQVDGQMTGWQTLSVAWLESQGPYMAPRQVDEHGNGDGIVCGLPLPAARAEQLCGGPCQVPVVYVFRDDSITPWH